MKQKEKGGRPMENWGKQRKGAGSNQGITLIVLVVTVIVLLILAGISISAVTGENGIIEKTVEARRLTKIAEVEEQANLSYLELELNKGSSSTEEIPLKEIIKELEEKGYEIKTVLSSGGNITGISLDRDEITVRANETATINVTIEGLEERKKYYVVIDRENYEIRLENGAIKVSQTPTELDEAETGTVNKLEAESSDTELVKIGNIGETEVEIIAGPVLGIATVTIS